MQVTDLRNTVIYSNSPAIQRALFEHGATWNHGSVLISHKSANGLVIDSENKVFYLNADDEVHNKKEIWFNRGQFFDNDEVKLATELSERDIENLFETENAQFESLAQEKTAYLVVCNTPREVQMCHDILAVCRGAHA